EVKNPGATVWPASMTFTAVANPLRSSPAIHVNQEGYVPSFPKRARIGAYLGSLGEMNLSGSPAFKLVNAATGQEVFQGALTPIVDAGYNYSPLPYQKTWVA